MRNVLILILFISFLNCYGQVNYWSPSGQDIYRNSKVGIGITSPSVKLQVNGGNENLFNVNDKFTVSGLGVVNWGGTTGCLSYGGTGATIGANTNKYLALRANNLEHLRITTNGNIGIGNFAPSAKLEIYQSTNDAPALVLSTNGGSGGIQGRTSIDFKRALSQTTPSTSIKFQENGSANASGDVIISTAEFGDVINFNSNGNIGIGTESPQAKLDVRGNVILGSSSVTNRFRFASSGSGSTNSMRIGTDISHPGDGVMELYQDYAGGNDQLPGKLVVNGKMGIGIAEVPSEYQLAVFGKIITEEVKVKLESGWPDYVFAKEYNLPTLEEVENHINEKGHLKDIPSAADVEENGIFLGEMDAKLLQKIEELTLYQIEANKLIVEMKARIDQLENKLTNLEK